MKTKTIQAPSVNVITLGCSKNLVDSEVLINQLQANKFKVAHEKNSGKSDIIIVNTCGFIDVAKQESIDTILYYAQQKSKGKIDKLYVTGCLSQRYKDDLEKEIPEVDAFFGTLELPFLLEKLGANYKHELIGERNLLTTPKHYAYLKISEGCNRTCSFCAIPLMRGKHVSKPIENLVQEATHLVNNGVKEIMLIAQELTYYGLDIYKERSLALLLQNLAQINGLNWIRLHYAYPYKFPLNVLEVINQYPNICKYLDMPIQHISNSVLKNMRRLITKEETYSLIQNIREKVPNIALRTTLLVGFPNETQEDIEELADFIRFAQFDRLGVFQYSHEENTFGHEAFNDNIPAEVKAERAAYIMDVQQEISEKLNKNKIGKVFKTLFDRKEGNYFIGRTEFDSPEVDNEVLVDATKYYAKIGDFANVKITHCEAFDLYGDIIAN